MAISKVIFNGDTLMDVTGDTVEAGKLLYGETATKNDGTSVTGSIATKTSSDLYVSAYAADTVIVPAGYYASQASKSVGIGTVYNPVATKGTVSNHSVSVTPSVAMDAGYIDGGNQGGAAVTVTASELVSGTKSITENGTNIDVTDYAAVDVAVSGGGGATNGGVKFIDYDGTIVQEYTSTQAAELSALPSNPTHTGLTSQGWNWTLAEIQDYLDDYPEAWVIVGQMYVTTSGATEIDITLDDSDFLSPELMIAPNGTVVVDWGDGSSTSTVTGTSLTTNVWTGHTYSQTGSYTVKLSVSSGSFAFYLNNSVTGIFSNSQRTSITTLMYDQAYSSRVTGLRIGNNASIGLNAFQQVRNLTTITIPSGVKPGLNAFDDCNSLKFITIPSGITSSSATFRNNYSLSYLSVPASQTSFTSNCTANCSSLTMVTIPAGVTQIANYQFSGCYALSSIVLPSSVTKINSYAFENCYSLCNISIPSGVTQISSNAFSGCSALSLTGGLPTGLTTLGQNAFSSCFRLAEAITIPNTITTLNTQVLSNVHILKSVQLPSSITSIPNFFLNSVYRLQSITIPSTVTSIGQYSFMDCVSLKSVTLPSGVTSIGQYAFNGCHSLSSINIPSGVTAINGYTFQNCESLKTIDLPSGVTSIGTYAFNGCVGMKSIDIPSTVTSIGNYAFAGCRSLQKLTLPSALTSVGTYFAAMCASIREISIPSGITSLSNYSFQNCYSLKSVQLTTGLTSIGQYAFYQCYSLTEMTVPSTVTTISAYAFYDCTNILEYHMLPTTPPTLSNINAFNNINANCVIYVPYSADHSVLTAYQTKTNWANSNILSKLQEEPQS